jgi:hypothetical protein
LELDFALLADSAQIQGGKTYVLGGGISVYWTPQLPSLMPAVLVLQLSFQHSEARPDHSLRVNVIDSDGNAVVPSLEAVVPVASNPHMPDDIPITVSAVIPFPPVPFIQRPGGYEVNIIGDGKPLKSLPFHVVRGAPPQPFG